jgi:mutator protein MutT
VEVAAALVFRDGKLLIAQRPAGAHLGGLWEFPGGKKEPGETAEQCLSRELREELGIEAEVLRQVETLTYEYPEKTVRLEFLVCRWLRHEPQALECADCRWITPAELDRYEFPPADVRLLAELRERWQEWAAGPGQLLP